MVTVCAGTYHEVIIDRVGLNLEGVDGAAVTFIDGGSDPAITVEDVTATITGFTLTGQPGVGGAAALRADGAVVLLTDSWVAGATTSAGAYSAYAILSTNSDVSVLDDSFENNELEVLINAYNGGLLQVRHSTFVGNDVATGSSNGGLWIFSGDAEAEISNNIFISNTVNGAYALKVGAAGARAWVYNNLIWNNVNDAGMAEVGPSGIFENNIVASNIGRGISRDDGSAVGYNDVWEISDYPYTGFTSDPPETDISVDPWLVDPEGGDFTLDASFSPCVNAGDPLAGYNDVDGTQNDMGAYGGPYGAW